MAYRINSAKNSLKRIFAHSDSVTLDDIFRNWGRSNRSLESNMTWLSVKLALLRHYSSIDTIYETTDRKRLVGLKLSREGKKLLGRDNDINNVRSGSSQVNKSIQSTSQMITLESVTEYVDEFNRQNPSWELEIVPKRLKKEVQPTTE